MRPLAGAQVRTDEIELGLVPIERRAMPDEQHEELIVHRHAAREGRQHTLHVLARPLNYARTYPHHLLARLSAAEK